MKNFALIGAAGYVAPRHMKAIKDTENRLVAALDKNDSVGIIDDFFPEADFFTEFERFDRHIEKLRRMKNDKKIDYISIASPNYLHDAHIRFALRVDSDAICEKPLVLNPWNIEALREIEKEFGKRVYSILQLRYHPAIQELKKMVDSDKSDRIHAIDLTYITGRGRWYYYSWKGDETKSGGIATNIGIHFFDILIWIFGAVKENYVHFKTPEICSGFLVLERAIVRWYLSLKYEDIPEVTRKSGKRIYRCLNIDDKSVEFTEGLSDLHTISYKEILKGNGYGLVDSYPGVDAVYHIRHAQADISKAELHPFFINQIRRFK